MLERRAWWGIFVAAVLLLMSGCARQTRAEVPVSDALRQDATAYAEAQDVSLEEAIERLRRQDPAGELNTVLSEEESDVFAGLWIEHEPEYKVVVWVVKDEDRIRRRYVHGTSLEDVVEVRGGAEATAAELDAIHAETRQILDQIGSRVPTGTNVRENCVEVYADPEILQARLDIAGAALPNHVGISPSGPYPEPPPLDPPPGIVFPRQHPPEGPRAEMAALLIGRLIEEDGCLRVSAYGQSHLIIWPYDHTVSAAEDGTLQIRDGTGAVVAQVGEGVRMGGGEIPSAQRLTPTEIPERCGGPYWLAANEIEPASPEELQDSQVSPEPVPLSKVGDVDLEALVGDPAIAPLLETLRAQGLTLDEPGASQAHFLTPEPGIAYRLDEESWIHLHVFPDPVAAAARAETIAQEMPHPTIGWVAPPHFYLCDRVIALYLGTDIVVQRALSQDCNLIAGPSR